MHPVGFQIKQAHLSFMRLSRSVAERVGLTPARLEMLRAVLERYGKVRQSLLRRLLGVCNSVVSIMVRAIERLGFLARERCAEDTRTFVVWLTRKGRYALRRAFYDTAIEGFRDLALVSIFVQAKMPRPRWEETVYDIVKRLQVVRDALGIGWTKYNPWSWTDYDDAFYFAAVEPNPNRLDLAPEQIGLSSLADMDVELPETDELGLCSDLSGVLA